MHIYHILQTHTCTRAYTYTTNTHMYTQIHITGTYICTTHRHSHISHIYTQIWHRTHPLAPHAHIQHVNHTYVHHTHSQHRHTDTYSHSFPGFYHEVNELKRQCSWKLLYIIYFLFSDRLDIVSNPEPAAKKCCKSPSSSISNDLTLERLCVSELSIRARRAIWKGSTRDFGQHCPQLLQMMSWSLMS